MILRIQWKTTLFVITSLLLATLGAAGIRPQDRTANQKDTLIIEKVEIVRYKKAVDAKRSADFPKYGKACPTWNLTKEQITQVITGSRLMDGHEFHYYFDVLPCSYKGEVIINGILKYEFEVNAGSYVILFKKGVTLFMSYDKKDIPFSARRAVIEE